MTDFSIPNDLMVWCACEECSHEWLPIDTGHFCLLCWGCYLNQKQTDEHHRTIAGGGDENN